jgi:hypothetical protein
VQERRFDIAVGEEVTLCKSKANHHGDAHNTVVSFFRRNPLQLECILDYLANRLLENIRASTY